MNEAAQPCESNGGRRCQRHARFQLVAFGCLGLLLVLGASGCASLRVLEKRPEVKTVSVTVVGLNFAKADLRFDVEVANSSDGALRIAGYDYDLQIEGQPLLTGMSEASFELKPQAVTVVPVPVSIRFADVLSKLAALMGRTDVSYNLAVALTVKTAAGEFRLPFQKEGRLSLLQGLTLPRP